MSGYEDKPGKVLRVALLGCGVVGTQVARLLGEQADDLAVRTGARLELAGIAVRRIAQPRPGVDPRAADDGRDGPGDPPRRGHRHRGDRRHRAGPLADPGRHGGREVRGHREQGAARRARRAGTRGVTRVRHRPVLRGGGGGRDPDPPAAARVARRRHGAPGARHRQRHHQLHPRPDGRLGRRLRRVARRGAVARLRGGRPDRRRGGVRRRRQGRDPGRARVPHPGHRRRRLPRGHHRGDRGGHRLGEDARPDREAARDLRAVRAAVATASRCASTRR